MEETTKHISFHIFHKSGTEVKLEAANLEKLIEEYFPDRNEFEEKVEKIGWKIKSTLCIYDPRTRKIERKISDGDINPFGWRMKHH